MLMKPIELYRYGPFRYCMNGKDAELRVGGADPRWAGRDSLKSLVDVGTSGIYLFCVDHHIHGPATLAYIGRTIDLGKRLLEHDSWIRDEWNVETYAAAVPEQHLNTVEALLIYAHSPIYNSQNIWNPPDLPQGFHVRNTGHFKHLLPDVCADHPWFSN
jgi:hypothetical protein